ncbi:hypothetical protein QJS66_19855 [Kocuria rhizophila]|nr:hypothetical protein QJS66_19855 [Kocuria rhizophila]
MGVVAVLVISRVLRLRAVAVPGTRVLLRLLRSREVRWAPGTRPWSPWPRSHHDRPAGPRGHRHARVQGQTTCSPRAPGTSCCCFSAGVVAAVPCCCSAPPASRLPLSTVGMIQYVAPMGSSSWPRRCSTRPCRRSGGPAVSCGSRWCCSSSTPFAHRVPAATRR